MAEHGSATIDVDASAEDLFDIVVDIEAYPDWVKGMKEVIVHSRTSKGLPKRATMTVDAGIKVVTYTLVYTYKLHKLVAWTSESGDLKQIDGSYAFEVNDDGGTTVTYELTIDPGFKIPGFLIRQASRAIMSSALDGLKARAEDR
jgi:ribosome-associated toxin RatA of RatAB toxin-antitoxin module